MIKTQHFKYLKYKLIYLGQYLWALKALHVYHPILIISTFFITIVLIQIPPTILYSYGYNKYVTSLASYRKAARQNQQLLSKNSNFNKKK